MLSLKSEFLLLNLLNEISYLFKKPAWGILRGVFG